MATLPINLPYHVRLVNVDGGQGFVTGYETYEQAEVDAKDRSERAEKLSLSARYEVLKK